MGNSRSGGRIMIILRAIIFDILHQKVYVASGGTRKKNVGFMGEGMRIWGGKNQDKNAENGWIFCHFFHLTGGKWGGRASDAWGEVNAPHAPLVPPLYVANI